MLHLPQRPCQSLLDENADPPENADHLENADPPENADLPENADPSENADLSENADQISQSPLPLSQRLMEFVVLSCLAITIVVKVFLMVELFQDLELDIDNQQVEALLIQEATEY